METDNLPLDAKIEALLFYKGEPISYEVIAKAFGVSQEEAREAVRTLGEKLTGRGLALIQSDYEATLGTEPTLSSFFENLRKDELTKELSKASLETLSIVLYKKSVGRSDIDYIRGVNSSFILRNLLVRGLIDKRPDANDSRTHVYSPSVELLSLLGVARSEDLPDYDVVSKTLEDKISESIHENNL